METNSFHLQRSETRTQMDLSELGWFNLTRLRLSLFFSVKIGLVNVGVIVFLYSKNRGFVFVIIKKK